MKMIKKVLALLLLFNFLCGNVLAADMVDDSIDSGLRAKYNTKKIEDDLLPSLPQFSNPFDSTQIDAFSPSSDPSPVLNTQTTSKGQPAVQTTSKPQSVQTAMPKVSNSYVKNNIKTSIVLNSGKKFKVKLLTNISDKTPEGSRLSFVSLEPQTFRYITIPSGTVFKAKIVDSHPPYLSGNGGLIVIQVTEMIYKGVSYEIDAKVSVANDKHIFFNNIKGKRKYMKNMWNSTSFGSNFMKKMWKSTCKYAKNGGLEWVLTPITLASGVVVYGANVISSPVLALFSKGGSISIPAGTKFVIQLREDAVILN